MLLFLGNVPKPPISPVSLVSLSQSAMKRREINRPWPLSNLQAIPSMRDRDHDPIRGSSVGYWFKVKFTNLWLHTLENILQNISTFHIELLFAEIIILISMKWRLWIEVFSWTCFFQLLTNICIYTAEAKMIWKLPMRYIIHAYTLWSVLFWKKCIWLAAYVDCTANELWSGNGSIWPSAHLQLVSDAWVATRQMAQKPILWLLMIYVRSMFVKIQTLYPYVRTVLVFGQWEMT